MITGIRLIGCQSWEDNVIHLSSSSVNVLKADNSSGKSVLFKMLKITACPSYYTPKEKKKLIRYGHDSALILYSFDDGTLGGCRVFPTKVIYLYSDDGKIFTQYDKPPRVMIEKLGLVNNGEKFIANIIDMDQPLLLVDSNVHENYDLMKLLTENAELSEIREKAKMNITEFEELEKDLKFTQMELDNALIGNEYKDLDKMEFAAEYAEKELQQLYQFEDIINILSRIKNKWITPKPFGKMALQLDTAEKCEMICKSLKRIQLIKRLNYDYIDKEFDTLSVLNGILESLGKIRIINFHNIKRSEKLLEILEISISAKTAVSQIKIFDEKRLNRCFVEISTVDTLKSILKILNSIQIYEIDYERCFSILQTITFMKQLLENLDSIAQNKKEGIKTAHYIKEIEEKLKQNGEVFECSRFGRVIYNGGECVHYLD